ncbi:Recombinase [Sporomusa ovata DSM 2662]|uniref:Site-specific recombinase n=1 Tax=Sporomusa ovata TaxID=2378 RepID=A0A0U1L151_9FIRM|nr:recombinase family protein [Sporomusa ovata]EQB27419.1 site-specific recombinase, resolvase family [Sporomusa ovata DSM 2662]CQR73265.1 Site-specific recombinase [Sporomusa ovata]
MKVAIYCRLSEEDKNKQLETDDSESIQNQKSMLIQYAMDRQWNIYNIYSDDDYTGSDRNRPAFNQLLDDAKNHKFDIVLCKTQSRFTRELELVEKYIHTLFPLWRIRFVSVVDNADTEVKGNKKARQINGLINEWYLEDMSENIKSVLTNKRKNGAHIGSFALYGYQKDPNQKGHLIIDEDAAKVVREVFTLFSQGYGKTAIARILNDRGIPNPTEHKRLKNLRYKQPKTQNSTLWKYFAISDMLTNEIYIGNMVQGKYGSISYKTKENKPIPKEQWIKVKGTHSPIIDRELWDNVQELVREKAKPFIIGTIGIFAKKARCMYCDYVMRSTKSHDRYYLKCETKHVAKDACIGAFIPVEELENAVISELRKIITEYLDKDELEQQVSFNNNLSEKREKLKVEIATFEKKASEYAKGIKDLYLDKVKGIISESEFLQFSKEFYTEKERLEKVAMEAKEKQEAIDRKMQSADNRRQIIEEYIDITKLNREMTVKLIDFIYVGRRNPETKQIPIEIHWNF